MAKMGSLLRSVHSNPLHTITCHFSDVCPQRAPFQFGGTAAFSISMCFRSQACQRHVETGSKRNSCKNSYRQRWGEAANSAILVPAILCLIEGPAEYAIKSSHFPASGMSSHTDPAQVVGAIICSSTELEVEVYSLKVAAEESRLRCLPVGQVLALDPGTVGGALMNTNQQHVRGLSGHLTC